MSGSDPVKVIHYLFKQKRLFSLIKTSPSAARISLEIICLPTQRMQIFSNLQLHVDKFIYFFYLRCEFIRCVN